MTASPLQVGAIASGGDVLDALMVERRPRQPRAGRSLMPPLSNAWSYGCDDAAMPEHRRRWDSKLGREVLVEINKGACPDHPDEFQRPGWTPVGGHAHRTWRCGKCDQLTHDPNCEHCQPPPPG